MLRSVRSEFLKVTTTRIWWILAIILFGYVGLTAAGLAALFSGIANDPQGPPLPPEGVPPLIYSFATSVGYVFPLLFGALMTTGEFRNKTLTPTFLATPQRWVVLGGKVAVGLGFGVVYAVVALLASVGLGATVLAVTGTDTLLGSSDTWALIGRIVIAMALWTVIGTALGVLVPHQVATIVIVLAFTQFVEPLLRFAAAFWDWSAAIGTFLPGSASDALVGSSVFSIAAPDGGVIASLEWWQGGLVLACYAAVFLVAGALTTWRRDVT